MNNLNTKLKIGPVLVLMLVFLGSIAALAQQRVAGKEVQTITWQGRETPVIEGEILLKVTDDNRRTAVLDNLKSSQAEVLKAPDKLGWMRVQIPASGNLRDALEVYQKVPGVIHAEPNVVMRTSLTPNDLDGKQWSLQNTGQSPANGTNDADIDAPEAWELTTGSSDVVIAVLDSGIPMQSGSLSHPDLNDPGKIILGLDAIGDGQSVRDELGHGTHVAGIAAAESNNGIGISGTCWECKVLVIQVFDAYGGGSAQSFYDGVIHASDYQDNYPNERVVINYSGGGPSGSTLMQNALTYAANEGVLVVASAGNQNGGSVLYPAAYSGSYNNLVAVSSTDPSDTFSSFSSKGPQVSISAPGGYETQLDGTVVKWDNPKNIYSTTPNYTFTMQTDPTGEQGDPYTSDITQSYGYLPGTSMAAPHVAATAALMLAKNPALTPAQLKNILQNTADEVSGMGGQSFTNEYGHGRLNALKAVYQAQRLAVQDQMVNFRSLDSDASGPNNSRRSVYEPSIGATHVVFQSGSEVAYFKRMPWGSPTQPILISENQTTDFGKNLNPNITIDTNGNLHAVWERKAYGSDQWRVYYTKSTNDGATWSAPQIVSPVWSEPMNPQILAYDSYYDNEIMLTYYYLNRIRARVYNSSTGNWDKWGSTDAIPYTSSYTQNFSAIASDRYGNTNFNVVYKNGSNNHIYHNHYNYSTSWNYLKNLSSIVSGTATHHSPSVSNDPSYATGASPAVHVAWTRTTGSGTGQYDNKVIHRWTSNVTSWPSVYYTTYYQYQTKPAITGIGSTGNYKAYLVYEIQGNGGIARQYFNGSSWNTPVTITSNGKYPSLSTGGNQARYFYTDETGPFYDVTLSSQLLTKTAGEDPNFDSEALVYKRAVSFMDSSGAYLEFIVHNVTQTSSTGITDSRTLNPINQEEVDLSISKALKTLNIPDEFLDTSSNLEFKLEIKGHKVMDLFVDEHIPGIRLGNELWETNDQNISPSLGELADEMNPVEYSITLSSEILKDKNFDLLSLDNLNFREDVYASLGHILAPSETSQEVELHSIVIGVEDKISPSLSAYPNPFNPNTSINFSLPEKSFVKLKVFDLLGREVALLVNEERSKGEHQVLFNASNLASGIYLYRLEAGNTVIINKMTLIK